MAMDYIPIQGSSFPCDQIFSSSGESGAKADPVQPVLMEALTMLKFSYKKSCLDFSVGCILYEKDLDLEEPHFEDLLSKLLSKNLEHANISLNN